MREFARRFAFANLDLKLALLVDIPTAILTVLILAGLGWSGRLSAETALVGVGLACATASLGWLFLARKQFSFSSSGLLSTLNQSWSLGKWFLSSQIALQAQGYATPWLALAISGVAATGVYTACASIVGFANPLLYGFLNVLTPKSASALNSGGVAGLRRHAARATLLLAAVMGAFCLLVVLIGDQVLALLYPGAEYRGNGGLLVLLALATFAGSLGAPASIGLAAAERARATAIVFILTAILNLLLVCALLPWAGLWGAAWGMLVAELVGSVAQWLTFYLLVTPKASDRDLAGLRR